MPHRRMRYDQIDCVYHRCNRAVAEALIPVICFNSGQTSYVVPVPGVPVRTKIRVNLEDQVMPY